jgi:hypothetical protein
MSHDHAAAREAIRHTMARYNMAGDRGRLADLAATFAPDGVLAVDQGTATGPAAIVRLLEGLTGQFKSISLCRHSLATCLIDLTGPDSAEGRTYFNVITDIGPDHSGVYADRFRRVGDAWLIAHRRVRVDWAAPNSLMLPGWQRPRPA